MGIRTLRVAAVFALLAAQGCAPGPSLDQLIERNTIAMGGRERLERLHSVQIVRNPTMIATTVRPGNHKVELFHPDGRFRYAEGISAATAWEQTEADSARRVITGRSAEALSRVLQWPGPLNPLYRVLENGHRLTLLGDTLYGDVRYHRLHLALSDGFERQYYVNAETYLIERARDFRRLHAAVGTEEHIESVWGDFRDVDGVVLPHYAEERNYETGERFYGTTFLDVSVDVDVAPDAFSLSGRSTPDRLFAIVARKQGVSR